MSTLRIAVLVHKDLVPPDPLPSGVDTTKEFWETEYDVISNLKKMGHEVKVIGVHDDLGPIRRSVYSFKPHCIFNLLEEFANQALFDQHVVSYLELLHVSYTGCNPRGLTLSRDKALAKKVLTYHKIKTPKFLEFPYNRAVKRTKSLQFPLIVKCLNEEASLGISQASVVHSDEKLLERVNYIHEKFGVDAIAETFVSGREVYVGVLGNYRLETFAPWELKFENVEDSSKEIYSNKAKFDHAYRRRKGVNTGKAKLSEDMVKKLQQAAKRTYKALDLSGYARIDFRIDENDQIWVLEANPNPDISSSDEFAASAKHGGYNYHALLNKLLSLGRGWNSRPL